MVGARRCWPSHRSAQTIAERAAWVSLGLVADRLLGEPPDRWHPVAAFGHLMEGVEKRWYRDSRVNGTAYAVAGMVGAGLVAVPGSRTRGGRSLVVGAATYACVAEKALEQAAAGVGVPLRAGQMAEARTQLRSLVGRDPTDLDSGEIARAVVESVAENSVDAVVAPVFWALVGGAPWVLAYRAVNTLDAMVGHRSDHYNRFGWASARLDDLAGWIPARLTATLVMVVRPSRARVIWRAVRQQAPFHPSPNAGVAEAAFAAAMGLRLGGVNDYQGRIERRPDLGFGRPADPTDIDAARRLLGQVTLALVALCAVIGVLAAQIQRRSTGARVTPK